MKKLSVLLLFLNIFFCSAQSFKNDWKEFNCENWIIKIDEEKSVFLGKEVQYVLTFNNSKNKTRSVQYFVYKKMDFDSILEEEIQNYYMMQSCLFERGKYNFNSFYLNDYYYFLKPCHCNTKDNFDCENLAKSLEKYLDRS